VPGGLGGGPPRLGRREFGWRPSGDCTSGRAVRPRGFPRRLAPLAADRDRPPALMEDRWKPRTLHSSVRETGRQPPWQARAESRFRPGWIRAASGSRAHSRGAGPGTNHCREVDPGPSARGGGRGPAMSREHPPATRGTTPPRPRGTQQQRAAGAIHPSSTYETAFPRPPGESGPAPSSPRSQAPAPDGGRRRGGGRRFRRALPPTIPAIPPAGGPTPSRGSSGHGCGCARIHAA